MGSSLLRCTMMYLLEEHVASGVTLFIVRPLADGVRGTDRVQSLDATRGCRIETVNPQAHDYSSYSQKRLA
jgi:hypothetical protein